MWNPGDNPAGRVQVGCISSSVGAKCLNPAIAEEIRDYVGFPSVSD
jgi:hypothetical protein